MTCSFNQVIVQWFSNWGPRGPRQGLLGDREGIIFPYSFVCLVYMFRATRNLLPHKFSSYLIHIDQIHSHFTRVSVNYAISFARTTLRMASLQIMCPRLWNSNPTRVKQTQSIFTLKKELKLIFFSKYKNT